MKYCIEEDDLVCEVEVEMCAPSVDKMIFLEEVIDDIILVVDIVVDAGLEKYTVCVTPNSVSKSSSIFTISIEIFVIFLVRVSISASILIISVLIRSLYVCSLACFVLS